MNKQELISEKTQRAYKKHIDSSIKQLYYSKLKHCFRVEKKNGEWIELPYKETIETLNEYATNSQNDIFDINIKEV